MYTQSGKAGSSRQPINAQHHGIGQRQRDIALAGTTMIATIMVAILFGAARILGLL